MAGGMKLKLGDRVQIRIGNSVLSRWEFHFGTVTSTTPNLHPLPSRPGYVTITLDYGAGEIIGHEDDPLLEKIEPSPPPK